MKNKEKFEQFKEQIKNNTGFETNFNNPDIQKTIAAKNIQNSEFLKRRRIESNLKKYGVENTSQKHLSSESMEILQDSSLLTDYLKKNTRVQTANILGCSKGLIDKKIKQFELVEFQKPSYYEELFASYLDSLSVNYIRKDRKILSGLELDFYLPEHNLAVEINGLTWHSELSGKKDKNYHLYKYTECKKQEIKLIHIFTDEMETKPDVIKSIFSNIFNKAQTKIMARKCVTTHITKKQADEFLNLNHLHQSTKSGSYRIGLFFNDELVQMLCIGKSVATAGKNREEYELVRVCTKNFYNVAGGLSKLWNFFIKELNPTSVVSYSDLRYFDGNSVKNVGFEYSHTTAPGFWYINKKQYSKRIHRYNLRKQKLKEMGATGNTGWEMAQSLNFDRIWDIGMSVWKWKN